MQITLKDDQGTSFSTPAAFDDGTERAEFAASDDNTSPATFPAFYVKITIGGVDHIVHVPADNAYGVVFRPGRADNAQWSVAAAAGTADITCLEL